MPLVLVHKRQKRRIVELEVDPTSARRLGWLISIPGLSLMRDVLVTR